MPPVAVLSVAALLLAAPAPAGGFAGFDDFLGRLERAPTGARAELTGRYVAWQRERGGFPVVEKDAVVFVYVGSANEKAVRVIGDFKLRHFNTVLWDASGEPLSAAGGVFWRRMRIEPDARLQYQFLVDGKLVNDPLNPRTFVTGISPAAGKDPALASDLVMPGYHLRDLARPRGARPGRTVPVEEAWANPKVTVHLPAGYDPARRYPVLYVADGGAWARFLGITTILDNLAADGSIEPVIAVLIDPTEDRSGWYNFRAPYLPYLEKVVTWVDAHYATRATAAGRVHVGSSAGARATLAVVLERPDLFAGAGLFSPTITAPPSYFEPYITGRKRPDPRLRFWLSAGSYEGYVLEDARWLERYLRTTGIAVAATYTHEAHSLAAYQNLAGDMLVFFFPGPKR